MHPLLKELQRDNDPHDVVEITPDIVLAARADHELPTLAPGAVRHPVEPSIHAQPIGVGGASTPSLDATFRADNSDRVSIAGERRPRRKWVTRTLFAFLFALGSGAAAEGWRHYGDTARQMIAHWTPWTVATAAPPANPAPPEQPASPDAQATAPAQAAPAAPSVEAATSAGVAAPDQAESLQAMAQQIEQLKASIDQLKANQEQMARDLAKASEAKAAVTDARASDPRAPDPNPRSRIAAPRPPPPRAVVAQPARKPRPTFSAVQTAPPPPLPPIAAAPAPLPVESAPQATVETDGNPVVRPPMPLR
jgi:hypothetical protein